MVIVLQPLIDKTTNDKTRAIINNQVIPWAFLLTSQGVKVNRFDGGTISYSRISFFGTPELVFWKGYIEPYIEDLVITSINLVLIQIKENNLEPKKELDYLTLNLYKSIEKIYKEMQRIDLTLKNSELKHEEKKSPAKIENKIMNMKYFVDQHIDMELNKIQFFKVNKKWADIFLLEPNFFGLGINIKEFFKFFRREEK